MAVQTQIQVRRGTAATWTSTNPTLAAGEWGLETDTGKYKVGTGSAVWTSLGYASILPSTVTTKGDLLAATGNATVTRQAVGTDGSVLMADSSASTGVSYSPSFGFSAGKNKIINGDFGVWQRGTSFTNPAASAYTADRFFMDYSSGTVNCVVSQQAFTAGTAPVSGYESQYFLRISQSAATAAKSIYFGQRIEDVRTFAGQTVTFSFWAKANASKTISTRVVQGFGSGGSTAVVTSGSNNSITTSWTRFTNTISIPSISGKTIGTSNYLQIDLSYDANAIQDIDIWGVQVEAGSVATAFQTATGTIQGELAACQRYYYRANANSDASYAVFGWGGANSTTRMFCYTPLPVQMRRQPTAIDYPTIGTYFRVFTFNDVAFTPTSTALDTNLSTANLGCTYWDSTGYTANANMYLRANGSNNAYLGFSAEL